MLFSHPWRIGFVDSVLEHLDWTREAGTAFTERILGEFSEAPQIAFYSDRCLYSDDCESDLPSHSHTQFFIRIHSTAPGRITVMGTQRNELLVSMHSHYPRRSYEQYCDFSRQYDPAPSPKVLPNGTEVPAYTGPSVDTFATKFGRHDLLEYSTLVRVVSTSYNLPF